MSYISPTLTLLTSAVKKAANSLNRDFSEIEKLQSSVKNHKEFVVASYGKIDRAIRIELGKIKPDYAIVMDNQTKPQGPYFIVSPLDGLSNFAHGIPSFALSAAICENDVISSSVVYSPASDELYFAEKGKGAYKEGVRSHERLRVSARKDLSDSLISTLISYKKEADVAIDLTNRIIKATDNIRISGCIALDLAYVAAGKLDASISYANQANNFAAGMLLVKEAGGYVYDINQKDSRSENLAEVMESGDLIAVNAELSKKVFELLK